MKTPDNPTGTIGALEKLAKKASFFCGLGQPANVNAMRRTRVPVFTIGALEKLAKKASLFCGLAQPANVNAMRRTRVPVFRQMGLAKRLIERNMR